MNLRAINIQPIQKLDPEAVTLLGWQGFVTWHVMSDPWNCVQNPSVGRQMHTPPHRLGRGVSTWSFQYGSLDVEHCAPASMVQWWSPNISPSPSVSQIATIWMISEPPGKPEALRPILHMRSKVPCSSKVWYRNSICHFSFNVRNWIPVDILAEPAGLRRAPRKTSS